MRLVVAGASRGIGRALAGHFCERGNHVVALSRTAAEHGSWIPCDLSDVQSIKNAVDAIDAPVDAMVYSAGIWEIGAFTSDYDFRTTDAIETEAVVSVNLLGAIALVRAMGDKLADANPGRVVLIGSDSGLDGIGEPEVAYVASKFGLRGAAQALNAGFERTGLVVSVINVGTVATDEVMADLALGVMAPREPIAISDVISATEFALSVSSAAVASEIDLRQIMRPQSR